MTEANQSTELARYPFHDQNEFPAEYVSVKLSRPINGVEYGVYVVSSGERLNGSNPIYSCANSESMANEIAFRLSNELPLEKIIYYGKCHSGISVKSAEIWIAKNKGRYEPECHLSIVQHEGRFAVKSTPNDWGQLEI